MVQVRVMSFSGKQRWPVARRGTVLQTGVTSAIEQSQLNATLLAIEEINSVGACSIA